MTKSKKIAVCFSREVWCNYITNKQERQWCQESNDFSPKNYIKSNVHLASGTYCSLTKTGGKSTVFEEKCTANNTIFATEEHVGISTQEYSRNVRTVIVQCIQSSNNRLLAFHQNKTSGKNIYKGTKAAIQFLGLDMFLGLIWDCTSWQIEYREIAAFIIMGSGLEGGRKEKGNLLPWLCITSETFIYSQGSMKFWTHQ